MTGLRPLPRASRPIFLVFLVISPCLSFNPGKTEIPNEKLKNVFKLLSDFGQSRLALEKNNSTERHVNEYTKQFLVVTVLSEAEIYESESWSEIPHSISSNKHRIIVQFNEKLHDSSLQLGKKPLHGEVICLYTQDKLQLMLQHFKSTQEQKFPYILMFSYYLPCANVHQVPYSCSEELGKEAEENRDKYSMLVAFEIPFNGTDSNKAKAFMCRGGVHLYNILSDGELEDQCEENHYSNPTEENIFQTVLLKLLKDSPFAKCSPECQHEQFTEIDFINYIDSLTNTCTKKSLMKGHLTEYSKEQFRKCAKEYTEDENNRYPEITRRALQICIVKALGQATVIGAKWPKMQTWKIPPPNTSWDKLYAPAPNCRFPRAFCNKEVRLIYKTDKNNRFENRHLPKLTNYAPTKTRNRPNI